jgi:putative transposase
MPYWRLFYHLTWATRDREPLIGQAEEAVIRRSMDLTFADLDLIPHAVGFMPEHVHVAVSIPPKVALAEAVKRLKGASAHAVNKAAGNGPRSTFGWQAEYGALSFGDNALPRVVAYVERQAEHHAAGKLWAKLERCEGE